VGIGNAYHRMRKPQQALEAFEKDLEADPTDGYTQRNLGGLLIMFDRVDEAVTHLRYARRPADAAGPGYRAGEAGHT
jgi:tetratricopeptide (TPR) repeat protein